MVAVVSDKHFVIVHANSNWTNQLTIATSIAVKLVMVSTISIKYLYSVAVAIGHICTVKL